MKIGIGYDAHRLVAGKKLILGGVEIPFDRGLAGYSDADALVHAIIDALLGASGRGDIGQLFPDTDERFKDAYSIDLLRDVYAHLRIYGYSICNIDSVVICQAPKIAPYVDQMKASIADALGISAHRIGIKGKTEEGLGFTGAGDGIKAQAVCLLDGGDMSGSYA